MAAMMICQLERRGEETGRTSRTREKKGSKERNSCNDDMVN
jgi:hypothetical protein